MGMLLHLAVIFITKRHSRMSWLNWSSLSLGCIDLNKIGSYCITYCDGPACWFLFLYLSHLDPAHPNWPLKATYGTFPDTTSLLSTAMFLPLMILHLGGTHRMYLALSLLSSVQKHRHDFYQGHRMLHISQLRSLSQRGCYYNGSST